MEAKKKIIHNRPLFYAFLALLLSITATRYIFQVDVTYIVLVSVALIGLFVFLILQKNIYLIFIFISVMLFGVCLFFLGVKIFEANTYYGTQTVEARITDDVVRYSNRTRYKLVDVKINDRSESNMYAVVYGYDQELQVGDVLRFNAEISKNQLFNLGGFNLSCYRDNAPYSVTLNSSDIEILDSHLKLDESFRLKVKDLLYENMGVENGATAFAVLFGNTNDISDETYANYQNAGILHLLAVSGLNVTFLITLLGYFLKLLKVNRWTNFLVSFFVLFAYVYLCGFAPSIVRAGIMGIIFLACSLSGRCYDGLNSLGTAGVITLLFSPLSAFDIGFLMSYFCVLGILIIHPVLSKLLRKFLPKYVADSFSISISSQIMILPFMASFYANFNLLSFFLNLIAVPLFGIIYPILFVAMILCVAMPFLGFVFTFLGYGFTLIEILAEIFSQTSLILPLSPLNAIVAMLMFAFFFMISRFVMTKWKNKIVALNICATFLIGGVLIYNFAPIAESPSIVYSYYYDEDLVVFTNTNNKTLVIDGYSFENINNALDRVNANKVVGHISLNNTLTQNAMQKLDSDYYFYNTALSAYDGCSELLSSTEYSLGGFKFRTVEHLSLVVGVLVEFDNVTCFVLNNLCEYNYEIAEMLDEENFDYLILGDIDETYTPFKEEVVLTYKDIQNSNHSFENGGSMLLLLSEKDYSLRRI